MTCPSQEAPDGAIGARYPGSLPLLCASPGPGPLKVAPVHPEEQGFRVVMFRNEAAGAQKTIIKFVPTNKVFLL